MARKGKVGKKHWAKLETSDWLHLVEIFMLLLTIIVAGRIGINQNKISELQTDINKRELDLSYQVSLVTVFNENTSNLEITNYGKTNVLIKTIKIHTDSITDFERTIIPPNGVLNVTSDKIPIYFSIALKELVNKYIQTKSKENLNWRVPLKIFVQSLDGKDYIVSNYFRVQYTYHIIEQGKLVDSTNFIMDTKRLSVSIQPSELIPL